MVCWTGASPGGTKVRDHGKSREMLLTEHAAPVKHSGESNWFRDPATVEQDLRIFRESCKYVLGWV